MFDLEAARVRYDDMCSAFADAEREDLVQQVAAKLCMPLVQVDRDDPGARIGLPSLEDVRFAVQEIGLGIIGEITFDHIPFQISDRDTCSCVNCLCANFVASDDDIEQRARQFDQWFRTEFRQIGATPTEEDVATLAADSYLRIVTLAPFTQGNVLAAEVFVICVVAYSGMMVPNLVMDWMDLRPKSDPEQWGRRAALEVAFHDSLSGGTDEMQVLIKERIRSRLERLAP